MADLPFRCFDADNHYYEALDAFTRHLEPGFEKRCMQWAEIGGRQRLLVGGRLNRFIPNPTFDPVARPGCLDEFFRGRNPEAADMRTLFGRLDAIHPSYRDPAERVLVMDEQGIESCDDWSFNYQNRIYAAPYMLLSGVDNAVAELEWALERDARVVCMVAGPVVTEAGSKSPADPHFDPFWARVNEAGVTVAYHGGDNGYGKYVEEYGEPGDLESFKGSPLSGIMLGNRAPFDTMGALISHRLFERYPNLRVASVEQGSNWVPWLSRTPSTPFVATSGSHPSTRTTCRCCATCSGPSGC
jgi:predicted TIM-barrel fold metal-dependent hydrolase